MLKASEIVRFNITGTELKSWSCLDGNIRFSIQYFSLSCSLLILSEVLLTVRAVEICSRIRNWKNVFIVLISWKATKIKKSVLNTWWVKLLLLLHYICGIINYAPMDVCHILHIIIRYLHLIFLTGEIWYRYWEGGIFKNNMFVAVKMPPNFASERITPTWMWCRTPHIRR